MEIELKNLTKIYGSFDSEVVALNGACAKIKQGEKIAIIGPSGSGKSTLLHLLSGIDEKTSGELLIDGKDITTFNDKQAAEYRRKRIGYVFQDFKLFDELTVMDNIKFPTTIKKGDAHKNPEELAEILGIDDKLSTYPTKLSGGQKQRVAIARALVNNPELILCDEPTGNLDQTTGLEVIKTLKEINEKDGVTLIIVTHDSSVANMMDRVIRITDGILEE